MFLVDFIPCLTSMYSLFELYTMSYRGNRNPVSSAETFYHLVDTHHFLNIFMLTEVFYVNFLKMK